MTAEETSFLEAIRDEPLGIARVVYADWLEERGFMDRADYLRLTQSWGPTPASAEQRAELFALCLRIDRAWNRSPTWTVMLDSLADADREFFMEGLRLVLHPPDNLLNAPFPIPLHYINSRRFARQMLERLAAVFQSMDAQRKIALSLRREVPPETAWREAAGGRVDLRIHSFGRGARVAVIRCVREIRDLTLLEARNNTDTLPIVLPGLLVEVAEQAIQTMNQRLADWVRLAPTPTPSLPKVELTLPKSSTRQEEL